MRHQYFYFNILTLKTINALASFSSKAYDCILSSSYNDGCRKSEPIFHTSRFQRGQAIKSSAAVRLSFIPWHYNEEGNLKPLRSHSDRRFLGGITQEKASKIMILLENKLLT